MNNHADNHTAEADRIRAELEDYLMDQNLQELLGGVTPNPEHRAVAPAPVSVVKAGPDPVSASSPARRSWIKPVALLATCAGIALVLFSGLLGPGQRSNDLASFQHVAAPLRNYQGDDVQYYPAGATDPLSAQKSALEKYSLAQHEAEARREEAYAMREIAASKAATAKLQTDKLSQLESSARLRQWNALPGIYGQEPAQNPQPDSSETPFADDAAPSSVLKHGRAESINLGTTYNSSGDFYNIKSRGQAGLAERYGRAPVLDYTGNGEYGGRTDLNSLYLDTDGDGDRGGFHRGRQLQNQAWAAHVWSFETDGTEGVGPGNRGDNYAPIIENEFVSVLDAPLSTFSIDVDTASYSNMRRMLTQNNMLPPPDAVRIEELVNYFRYDYPAPEGEHPFSVNVETASCPWRPENRLLRIALKGEEIPFEERPASNLVFLLDVSGSMDQPNKLPLLKSCFKMMVDYLTENDKISIVVYASGTRRVLPPTSGDQKAVIMEALDQLQAGGSTNGAGGIQLAYQTATENFIPGGLNRVILATDGDFNVGITSQGDLHRLIEEKAKSNVFLTTLGFGFGNLQDNTIELLADKGNGNYAYIDSLAEGRKVLIDEMGSTLNTIAKDVKIQIEFNPVQVAGYRLIGYENRILAAQDFNDDTKDAGEIGAGHTVTAFYELIPAGDDVQLVEKEVDELEFQRPLKSTKLAREGYQMMVKLRYKKPTEDTSNLIRVLVKDEGNEFAAASRDFQFAASVASFGMLLRNSKYAGQANYKNVLEQAQATLGETPESYRVEFVELVKLADRLAGQGRR